MYTGVWRKRERLDDLVLWSTGEIVSWSIEIVLKKHEKSIEYSPFSMYASLMTSKSVICTNGNGMNIVYMPGCCLPNFWNVSWILLGSSTCKIWFTVPRTARNPGKNRKIAKNAMKLPSPSRYCRWMAAGRGLSGSARRIRSSDRGRRRAGNRARWEADWADWRSGPATRRIRLPRLSASF